MKKRLTDQMSLQHIQDGVVYKIETNVSSIKKDKLNNKITPSKIIINGSRKMGEDPIVMQAGYFKIYEQIDGSDGIPGTYAIKYSSTSSETLVEYSPLYSASRLKIEFYENNAFTVKLDEKTIAKVEKAIKAASEATRYAHELGLMVTFFPSDASRSDMDFLSTLLNGVLDAGEHDADLQRAVDGDRCAGLGRPAPEHRGQQLRQAGRAEGRGAPAAGVGLAGPACDAV